MKIAPILVATLLGVVGCGRLPPAPAAALRPVPLNAITAQEHEPPGAPAVQPPFPALQAYSQTEDIFGTLIGDYLVALDANEVGLVAVQQDLSCIRFLRFRTSDLSMISKSGCFVAQSATVFGLVRTATRWLGLMSDTTDVGSASTPYFLRVIAFDDFGTRLAPVQRLEVSDFPNVSKGRIVSRPGGAMVFYSLGDSLRALVLDDDGLSGTAFDLGPGGHNVLASAWVGSGALVARNRDAEDTYGRASPGDAPIVVTYVPVQRGALRITTHSLKGASAIHLVELMGGPALFYRQGADEWVMPLSPIGEAAGAPVQLSSRPFHGLIGPVTPLGDLALFPQKNGGPADPPPILYSLVDRGGSTVAARVPIVDQPSLGAQWAAGASNGSDAIIAWRSGERGKHVSLARFHARPSTLTMVR